MYEINTGKIHILIHFENLINYLRKALIQYVSVKSFFFKLANIF